LPKLQMQAVKRGLNLYIYPSSSNGNEFEVMMV
jgi:hypothetical protein